MTCLENIIGISQKDCECFEDDRPADYDLSKSGLYLDELEGLTIRGIDSSTDCGDESVWSIIQNAIDNAILRFRTDLLTGIRQRFKERFAEFDGILGLRVFNSPLDASLVKPMDGIKIYSNCIKGSVFYLKGIETFFDTDLTDMPVRIYRTGTQDPIFTFTVDATANARHVNLFSVPIELPLWIDGFDDFSYYIVYDIPLGVLPLNTQLMTCPTCTDKKKWITQHPWYHWVDMGGIASPLYTTIGVLDLIATNRNSYGLNLLAKITCKKSSIICDENDTMDFEDDEIAMHIAYAIRLAAGISLLTTILQRPDSSFVALNEEQINHLINVYGQDYQNRMQYISINAEPNNECFVCNDQMGMGSILA